MVVPDIIEIIDANTFKKPIYAGACIATVESTQEKNIITRKVNTCGSNLGIFRVKKMATKLFKINKIKIEFILKRYLCCQEFYFSQKIK